MIFGSIVAYNHSILDLEKSINSFLCTNEDRILYIVDNSHFDTLKQYLVDPRIIYIFSGKNIGFGAAHNIAIKESFKLNGQFHFILNPDISFDSNIIDNLVCYIQLENNIGMIMPKILNLDGTTQHLPKLLPSPISIILRKIPLSASFKKLFLDRYELRNINNETPLNVPVLSGCFTLLNLNILSKVGLYDEKYFMYFEDWDLSRRVHKVSKTIYYPLFNIYHVYESGANKNIKLFFIFIESAFYYFTKWGWFIDKERKDFNNEVFKIIHD
jgi:GT2 family glycosyltransferase